MENLLLGKTKIFALNVIKLFKKLPYNTVNSVVGKQLLRSGTSVYANYRAVCRARSKPDFISKLGIVEEEVDESLCWLELMIASDLIEKTIADDMCKEANSILSMVVASLKTAKKDREKR